MSCALPFFHLLKKNSWEKCVIGLSKFWNVCLNLNVFVFCAQLIPKKKMCDVFQKNVVPSNPPYLIYSIVFSSNEYKFKFLSTNICSEKGRKMLKPKNKIFFDLAVLQHCPGGFWAEMADAQFQPKKVENF